MRLGNSLEVHSSSFRLCTPLPEPLPPWCRPIIDVLEALARATTPHLLSGDELPDDRYPDYSKSSHLPSIGVVQWRSIFTGHRWVVA